MFESAVNKLTAWYVAAILVIVILFSLPVFGFASNGLDRATQRQGEYLRGQMVGQPNVQGPPDYFDHRADLVQQERNELLGRIAAIDVIIVILGAVGSYFFAKRTLKPIEEAHEAQSRFTSDASHELRTPLATMQAEIEVALRDKKPTVTDLQQTLGSNLEEIARLRNLSDQLLALTRVDTDALDKKQFSLSKATQKRVTELEKQHSITIKKEIAPSIAYVGDELLLMEVLTIFVNNAVQYSKDAPEISVLLQKQSGSIRLAVRDNGVGISDDDQTRIFDRFFRNDTTGANVGGHGLGLALAKEIAKKSGAHIEVESELGVGSVFTLVLPKAS